MNNIENFHSVKQFGFIPDPSTNNASNVKNSNYKYIALIFTAISEFLIMYSDLM